MITIMQCVRKSTARPAKNAVERHKCESSSVDASGGPNKNNPNLFPIGDGFGLFVFFGKLNMGVRGR